jgi:uncharacterized protein (DUF427 family)
MLARMPSARPIERVADYPRPPRLEPDSRHVRVELGGEVIFDGTGAFRVLETFHPPTWYLPPSGFAAGALRPAQGKSFCEWKGAARYFDLVAGNRVAERAAWAYPDPTPEFVAIADYVALYPGRVDACFVDGEQVRPQPGEFYGGWITGEVIGPFKGERGSGLV